MASSPECVVDVLRAAEAYLRERGVDAPRRSIELLMGRLLRMSRLDLYLAHDRPLSAEELAALRPLVKRRGEHVPVAHLLGDWEFFGLELTVGPDVLVPRPETEHLVELAVELAPRGARCVDLGTGSGAIAIALAKERDDVTVTAVELCAKAAVIARENVRRHGVGDRVTVAEGSYWDALSSDARFHVVVSNPPYVDPARPEILADDVRRFEPALALFTESGDPASAYRAIAAELSTRTLPGGWVLLETGVGADDAALDEMRKCPVIAEAELRKDLAGIPRYVVARVRQPSA